MRSIHGLLVLLILNISRPAEADDLRPVIYPVLGVLVYAPLTAFTIYDAVALDHASRDAMIGEVAVAGTLTIISTIAVHVASYGEREDIAFCVPMLIGSVGLLVHGAVMLGRRPWETGDATSATQAILPGVGALPPASRPRLSWAPLPNGGLALWTAPF